MFLVALQITYRVFFARWSWQCLPPSPLSVRMIEVENRGTNSDEIWCGYCVIRVLSEIVVVRWMGQSPKQRPLWGGRSPIWDVARRWVREFAAGSKHAG